MVNDVEQFYKHARLPEAEDPFAAGDAEHQFIERLVAAGYAPDEAPVKVRVLLRQLALAWGLQPVPGEPYDGPLLGSPEDSLELRRRWNALPLEDYRADDLVRWRNRDGRWVKAKVLQSGETPMSHEAVLTLYIIVSNERVHEMDAARVQLTDERW
jgi:hypothetical protein